MTTKPISIVNGDATFIAIQNAIKDLRRSAPKDHDVVVFAFDLTVHKLVFYKPDTFLFRGIDDEGNHTRIVSHFTNAIIRIAEDFDAPLPSDILAGFLGGKKSGRRREK